MKKLLLLATLCLFYSVCFGGKKSLTRLKNRVRQPVKTEQPSITRIKTNLVHQNNPLYIIGAILNKKTKNLCNCCSYIYELMAAASS